jgi:DNA-binding NtrC family response regulator
MLQSEFDIVTAASGEEGLVSLRDHGPFAVVISDLQMAGMDGVQFPKRVRQVAPNAIRLLLADYLDLNGAVNAVNEGCVFRLLIKPCEKSLLTEAITKALGCYRERKEERVRIERKRLTNTPVRGVVSGGDTSGEQRLSARSLRTRAEGQQLVAKSF